MCYRCSICRSVVPHGTPMRKHSLYRKKSYITGHERWTAKPITGERMEIARELALCQACDSMLHNGVPLEQLLRANARAAESVPLPPKKYVSRGPRVSAQNTPREHTHLTLNERLNIN